MAVRACISLHGPLVWSIARRFSPSDANAEDATQVIFTELWKSVARYDPALVSEPLYIAMVARRYMIERLRSAAERPSLRPAPDSLASSEQQSEATRCTETSIAASVLATLDPRQRRVLSLAIGQGMTYAEVADATAVPGKQARSLIRRALVAVRKRLSDPAPKTPHKRIHTLLTDRAVAGLEPQARAELHHLLAGGAIDPSYEAAGAAIELALMAHVEPAPEYVEAAVVQQAGRYFGFAQVRPHEQTMGGQVGAPDSIDDDGGLGEFLLGGPELDAEAAPVRREWEHSPGIDEALESGVLESSLTDGRVPRDASPAESQRGEIVRDLEPGPPPAGHPAHRGKPPRRTKDDAPDAGDDDELDDELDDDDFGDDDFGDDDDDADDTGADFDPRSVSQSDLGPAASHSVLVHQPLSESRLARWATYVSAIAALVMLAIALWLYVHRSDPPDPEVVRDAVEDADDKLEWEFVAKDDPAVGQGAGGSVVWSSQLQQGVALLEGLRPNDPAESQYELWIVDSQRESPVPVEVFDIPADAEELRLTIDSELVIAKPTAFLVTVERPGGVVVSNQEHLALVAAPAPE